MRVGVRAGCRKVARAGPEKNDTTAVRRWRFIFFVTSYDIKSYFIATHREKVFAKFGFILLGIAELLLFILKTKLGGKPRKTHGKRDKLISRGLSALS